MLEKNLELYHSEILKFRQGLTENEAFNLKIKQRGFKGECDLYKLVKDYGEPHWGVLHDVWIGVGGTAQLDLLVVTSAGILVLDAKNYEGHYTHINGYAALNNKKLNHDVFTQLKRSVEKVNEMCKLLNYNGRVEGRVVFINPDGQVTIEGVISEFALTRAELVAMLRQMAEQENHTIKANLPPHKLKSLILEKYRIANPYPPKSLTVDEIRRLKPGLCCPNCTSLEVEMKRYLAMCYKCGFCETKENAMRRFLYQYGLLTHQRPIISTEALELLGKQINTHYISKILTKNFEKISTGRYTRYKNPADGLDGENMWQGLR